MDRSPWAKPCSARHQWPIGPRSNDERRGLGCECSALNDTRRHSARTTYTEVSPKLTADDLKELGITSLGHRRRLLEAIAVLRLKDTPTDDPTQSAISPTESLSSETIAERRPLCAMFCDLVGSTALSSRLDPEDLRKVIRNYQACVVNTIRHFDGFIARYVGDGVLIYFGWPEARETDAERAVRAGLSVAVAVNEASSGGERFTSALASPRDLSSSASRLASVIRDNKRPSARRRTSLRACKASPLRVRW